MVPFGWMLGVYSIWGVLETIFVTGFSVGKGNSTLTEGIQIQILAFETLFLYKTIYCNYIVELHNYYEVITKLII